MKAVKSNLQRSKLFSISLILCVLTFITSCSKDDNDPDQPTAIKIEEAVGTFKGKITVFASPSKDYYDAEVTVVKEGNDRLKVTAKTGTPYANATAKSFQAENIGDIAISSTTGSVEGKFLYTLKNKSLIVVTEDQSASDITFSFEGVKQ